MAPFNCPNCESTDIQYGDSFFGMVSESLDGIISVFSARHAKQTALGSKVLRAIKDGHSGGKGLFSLPRLFYNGIFKDADGNPTLNCRHCDCYFTICSHCNETIAFESRPGVGELFNCPSCKKIFQPTEHSDEFDKRLAS